MGGHLNPNGSVLTPGGLEAHILSLIVTLQLVSPFINCKLPGVNLPLMNCIQHTIGPMSLLFDSYFRCSRMNYRRAGPLITHGLHQLAITCLLVYNLAQGRTFFRYACVHLQLIAPYQKHARVALQFLNYAATEINMELDQIVLDILGRNRPNGFPGIEQVQAGRCRQAGIHLIAYPIEDNAQEQHPAVRQHMLQQQQHQMHTEHVQQQQQGINGAYLKPEPRSPQNDLLHLDTEEDSNFLAARHGLAEGSVTPGYHTHDPASGEPLHRVQLNPAQAHAHAQAQAQRRHHDQAHHAQSQVLAAHRAAEEAAHRNIEPLDPDNSIFAGEWAMNIGLSEDAPALDEPDHDSDGQEVNGNNGRFGLGRHTSSSPKAAEAQMMAAQAAGTATDADADAEGEEESPVDENAYDALFNDTIGDYQE
ncbi:hypothetical protein BJ508DRAFT_415639 [Ascobolus immersus RN42]|uniref:Uncharacterized protein n=1 Tax=Ascobolus immersus RN42 TaxID=1160509 RepID=A0A3N4I202_ASCIM|nr:hypothetical protein BJ508DRAFT_415639 [Ascobolus immersus RN42]